MAGLSGNPLTAESLKAATDAAKKLKLSVLDLVPAFAALASGQGVFKAGAEAVKWGAFSAALPIVTQLGVAFYGLGAAVKSIVRDTGSLQAAIDKITEIKGMEKMFAPLLGGIAQARTRIAELIQFTNNSPFQIKGVAEANRALQLLTSGFLSTQNGMKLVGDVAASTNTDIRDVSMAVGQLYNQLKKGQDIADAASQLREMGAISDKTANDITTLQESGAAFTTIWQRVNSDLVKSKGGMKDVGDEIGVLQQKLEESRQGLAEAFGEPFVDAEKTGIKSAIKVAENLEPVLRQVAGTLAQVTGGVDTAKAKFAAFATSIPKLGEVAGLATKALVLLGGATIVKGAIDFTNRLGAIGTVVGKFRDFSGLRALGDHLLKNAQAAREGAAWMDQLAKSTSKAGFKGAAAGFAKESSSFTRKAAMIDAGAALAGDSAAAGRTLRATGSAIGAFALRAIANPFVWVTAGAVALGSAYWQLTETQKANRKAVEEANRAHAETLKRLDEQIHSITTLDDKQRALTATTNALAEARIRLANAKLPIDENQLTLVQRMSNALGKFTNLFAGIGIGKRAEVNESHGTLLAKQAQREIAALEARRQQTEAVSNRSLVSDNDVDLARRRAQMTRDLQEMSEQEQLQNAPDSASRQAIFERQAQRYTGRATSGEQEKRASDETRLTQPFRDSENRKSRAESEIAAADDALGKLSDVSEATAAREKAAQDRITDSLTKPGSTGSREDAAIEADKARRAEIAAGLAQKQMDIDRANSTRMENKFQTNPAPAGKAQLSKEEGAEDRLLAKRIEAAEALKREAEEQARLLKESNSELERIVAAIGELQTTSKPVTFEGKTATAPAERKEMLLNLQGRAQLKRDDIANVTENQRRAAEAQVAARAAADAKRREEPNLAAEREILAIKDEGIVREEKMNEVARKRYEGIIAAETIIAKERGVDPNKVEAVRSARQGLVDTGRSETAVANKRQDLGFERRAMDIEIHTGRGPQEEISALQKQLELNRAITAAVRNRKGIGEEERNAQLDVLAKQHAEQTRALYEVKSIAESQARSFVLENAAVEAQAKGQQHLATLIRLRADAEERVVAAIRAGNTELAAQETKRGKEGIIDADARERVRKARLRRTPEGREQLRDEQSEAHEIEQARKTPSKEAQKQISELEKRGQKETEAKTVADQAAIKARDALIEAANELKEAASSLKGGAPASKTTGETETGTGTPTAPGESAPTKTSAPTPRGTSLDRGAYNQIESGDGAEEQSYADPASTLSENLLDRPAYKTSPYAHEKSSGESDASQIADIDKHMAGPTHMEGPTHMPTNYAHVRGAAVPTEEGIPNTSIDVPTKKSVPVPEPLGPPRPEEPTKPPGGDSRSGGGDTAILNEIKASIDNLAKQVSVA